MMSVEQSVEWELARETEALWKKTCPSVTLSTTNPTWSDMSSNPDSRCGKPATNRLSHGTAKTLLNFNNHTIHTDLNIPYITDVIKEKSTTHHNKLARPSNNILQTLVWTPAPSQSSKNLASWPEGKLRGPSHWGRASSRHLRASHLFCQPINL
jgi:hypothetical protein